jgi:transcriptional regulator with XRE-family HTH domain|nr:MAG TPA: Repressor protein CI [Caudoviricetes sp.]
MFSTQLKKYRKNNGYTQKQLAEAVGVTQQAVAKWETDKASPDPEMLQKISSMLNVTVDSLLDGATPKDKSKMPKDLNKFLQQSEIIFDGDTYNLTDEERELVIKSLEVAFSAAKQANKRKKGDSPTK